MIENKETFKRVFLQALQVVQGKTLEEASLHDCYIALSEILRTEICHDWDMTNKTYQKHDGKQVYYFSIEFLIGKQLGMNLINAGLKQCCEEGLKELGIHLNDLEEYEPEAGLGNGGLGRLAACFLDSMATLQLPGHGMGIRYKYGIFEQKIVNNYQVELPDNWLKDGYIWEFLKIDEPSEVKFGGSVRMENREGKTVFLQEDYDSVLAFPYDIPVTGYHNKTVNTLRLWSAEPVKEDFDLSSYNRREYIKTVEYKHSVEQISKILYPDDTLYEGRLLRLKQQYFFVSAGIQSIIRNFKKANQSFQDLPNKIAIHVNDTHPTLAIPELMRILIDEEGMGWDEAWYLTLNTISYTNHTILQEALEKWPEEMFKTLLPRIYMIVEEINKRFCSELWNQYPGEWDRISDMAIIANGYIYMAHLAAVGSYSVNGVAKVHTDILKNHVMANFNEFYPGKFNNKTNGITHRRWLLKANPLLSDLLFQSIGDRWVSHPQDLIKIISYADDSSFRNQIAQIKRQNKIQLASFIEKQHGISLDTESIFHVQVKRIHAYKRQILNVFHIMDLYNRLLENPNMEMTPRTFIFAGKAAPGYYIAKQTIKLINKLAFLINNDRRIKDKIKVVFLENYGVALGEMIFPATDISEQLSTASKEASGTGNMKSMMNGAVTIGTLDGANIEMRDVVGEENIIIFGLKPDEVLELYRNGGYRAWDLYHQDKRISTILEQLVNGFFPNETEEFRPIYDNLLYHNDEFFVLKDFASYLNAQNQIDSKFCNQDLWQKMSIYNIAHSGVFSSDRTISEYASDIWKIKPIEL